MEPRFGGLGGRFEADDGVVAVGTGSGGGVGEVGEAEGGQLGDGAAVDSVGVAGTVAEEASWPGGADTGAAGRGPPPPPGVEGPSRLPAASTAPPQASSTAASTDSPTEARTARGARGAG
ncbi:hypothetical protein ABTZ03_03045 [Kitasatospora sp. NPDC096077]|uniref:hypothetical protein n=1 Tax=Kitasatospora sp. NPDC096077 TaxID=3155544 RepID=UPI0033221D34